MAKKHYNSGGRQSSNVEEDISFRKPAIGKQRQKAADSVALRYKGSLTEGLTTQRTNEYNTMMNHFRESNPTGIGRTLMSSKAGKGGETKFLKHVTKNNRKG